MRHNVQEGLPSHGDHAVALQARLRALERVPPRARCVVRRRREDRASGRERARDGDRAIVQGSCGRQAGGDLRLGGGCPASVRRPAPGSVLRERAVLPLHVRVLLALLWPLFLARVLGNLLRGAEILAHRLLALAGGVPLGAAARGRPLEGGGGARGLPRAGLRGQRAGVPRRGRPRVQRAPGRARGTGYDGAGVLRRRFGPRRVRVRVRIGVWGRRPRGRRLHAVRRRPLPLHARLGHPHVKPGRTRTSL
mmetsp:Transcript_30547/g.71266  ORF Transcript_30547/g.71266 Transcript_30547/m.71266 type:complete len:251 (+) Transcript_30547:478-1230(+)